MVYCNSKHNMDLACSYYIHCSVNSKKNFLNPKKGEERGSWFIYTLLAIIIPFTSSKTSNLTTSQKVILVVILA